jgi:metallo-beta-lactamase family protein
MKMQFLGAARTVTGSSILVDTGREKVLVDCGLYQGNRELEERNYLGFDYQPAEIDFVLLTHAHIDHSGLLPRLWNLGFKGRVVTTAATADMARVMLLDSASIHERDAEYRAKRRRREKLPPRDPLYRLPDAQGVLELFQGFGYDQKVQISRGLAVRFRDAGHILGSASIELWASDGRHEVRLGFSGDLGYEQRPILRDPQPIDEADYLVVESTYGDRLHEPRELMLEELRQLIVETEGSGGRLIVPSFAVGRTQELLYYLHGFFESRQVPSLPVFVDSPMAIDATAIYRRHPECYDEEARERLQRGDSPFEFPGLQYMRELEESKSLNDFKGPCIVISASGMATHGRVRHHLLHGLPRKNNTVLFVGFQAGGTLGRALVEGAETVRIFGEEVPVRAAVRTMSGFSAHADRDGLLRWLGALGDEPQMLFVNHGEEDQSLAFAETVHNELGLSTTVPEPKSVFQLEARRVSRDVAAARRERLPEALLREATRLEHESQSFEARLRRLLTELGKRSEELQESDAAGLAESAAIVLDDLHRTLELLVEALLEGTETSLRQCLDVLGVAETRPWSELLRLVSVRRRTVVQSHEEFRAAVLKLAERLGRSE